MLYNPGEANMTFQEEHYEWVNRKYPNQPPEIPAAGCVEEAGELLHAVLKTAQVQRWGEDSRYSIVQLRSNLVDAIGDCVIYACSLCNANSWVFAELWKTPKVGESSTLVVEAVELVATSVEVALHPRKKVSLARYISSLKSVAFTAGIDPDMAIKVTWQIVKER